MAGSPVRVGCCQISMTVGETLGNRARVRAAIEAAVNAGARVIVLPELANSGYMFADLAELRTVAESATGPSVREWELLAQEHDLVIVAGFAEAGDDGLIYNSAVLVDKTGLRAVYRKVHLWDHEKGNLFTAGSAAPPVVDTAWGRIGVAICYDLEFPEWVRSAALDGAELLCCPVNWPLYPRPAGERPSEIVKVQANAAVNRMFIAVADRTGLERGQHWLGGSVIVDADGFPLTRITLGDETMLLADINLAKARAKGISARNDVHADRRPSLYTRVTDS
ncbi:MULTISPECIES: nitrilase-related carbon-nitrogen hydrolase [unclassified Cryobacterium]|uniref:nitrilase-related carbon-nitrogen hydrolase n=1 Tax=unclassified Cryobacterium TaxID=2649013 RepID=UPI0018EA77DC|nr:MULTISPECIES: nitrilase-related carbon-nitrogen hydrolase [unclassified Cryobacterium]